MYYWLLYYDIDKNSHFISVTESERGEGRGEGEKITGVIGVGK